MAMVQFTVCLNGTDSLSKVPLDLIHGAFSKDVEYRSQVIHLAKLGADPIPNTGYIRKHLEGWSKEFIDLCCKRFQKGKVVCFDVEFEDQG